jgi:hypothetical protein
VVHRLLLLAALASVGIGLLATGAGGSSTDRASASTEPPAGHTSLDRALRAWAGFPVARTPRPLVLLEGYVLDPENGFPDDNTKLAFGNGEISPSSSWPVAPPSSLGYPIVGAAQAFKTFTTPTDNVVGSPPPLLSTGPNWDQACFLPTGGGNNFPHGSSLFPKSKIQPKCWPSRLQPSTPRRWIETAPLRPGFRSPSPSRVAASRRASPVLQAAQDRAPLTIHSRSKHRSTQLR